jgi:hypothetical protein
MFMAQAVARLTEQEQRDLRHYAEVLRQYIHPEIHPFISGFRKLPKANRLEAERVSDERDSLQERLDLGWKYDPQRWKLEMVDSRGMPIDDPVDYWEILPIRAERIEFLDFLAEEVLPKVFRKKRFSVRDTYSACDGDCSWDCA